MVKHYSREPENSSKTCKASGHDIRVKFKNTHETAQAIKGMALKDAQAYLEKVMKKEDIIPFRRYRYGVGRKAQCKKYKVCNGRWPVKSCEFLLSLLKNAEGNATVNELNPDEMFIEHVQVNKAMQGRRRTYRAHGRINAFMNHPCHVEMWLTQREEGVAAEPDSAPKRKAPRLRSGVAA